MSYLDRTGRCAALAVCAALIGAGGAAAFDQTTIPYQAGSPAANGCPAGWEALALADLQPYGYHVPFLVDATGNGDGIVCGKPFTSQEQEARLPDAQVPIVFDFRDDDLNAAG